MLIQMMKGPPKPLLQKILTNLQNYPYPQDWFGHDEEDADDLAKD